MNQLARLQVSNMASKERTFTHFTPEQAAQYASGRGSSYPQELYDTILSYHQGERNQLLDVGCGPGKVVFDFVSSFKHGIGVDSSVSMIEQAKKDAVNRGVSDKTQFFAYTGEQCDRPLNEKQAEHADVITVAMAAHWMDMPAFYKAAEGALTPGGTLAIWTCSSLYVHPSTPNANALQEALYDLEDGMLSPYFHAGNVLTRNAYETLPLPWTIEGFESSFEKGSFVRKDWDRHGVPSAPDKADGTPGPYMMYEDVQLTYLERGLGTASAVIRWRDANPTKAHTEEDPVAITMKRLRERSGGSESLLISPSVSLLLMRRT